MANNIIKAIISICFLSLVLNQEEKSEKQMKVSACLKLSKARMQQDPVYFYLN